MYAFVLLAALMSPSTTLYPAVVLAAPPAGVTEAKEVLRVRCEDKDKERIIVDGLTGAVTYPSGKTTFRPGDTVIVGVRRANLIQYRYAIKLANKEALVAHYEIVGAGSVVDVQKDLNKRAAAETPDADSAVMVGYAELQDKLIVLRDNISDGLNALNQAERELNANLINCASWPDTLTTAREDFLSAAFTPASSYKTRARTLRDDYTIFARKLGAAEKTALESAINEDLSTITDILADLEKARAVVERWNTIFLSHPIPYIEQSFLIEDVSNRYTVSITKAPVSAIARAIDSAENTPAVAAPAAGTPPPDPVLATATFEGHALARLGVTLGLAGIARPNSRTYGLVKSVGSDNAVQYRVRETKQDRIDIRPIASILVYTSPVDNLDRNRKAQFLLTAGAEVSATPKTYVAGFGWDFPSGMVLTAGITRYTQIELAEGWTDGQQIPLKTDGTPVIDAVPTRESGAIGMYFGLQFRPAIFKALWNLVTPGK